jgi:hypothetical protein
MTTTANGGFCIVSFRSLAWRRWAEGSCHPFLPLTAASELQRRVAVGMGGGGSTCARTERPSLLAAEGGMNDH